ncbi:hypothetical protein H5410_018364 [Solanum commersonii]|uniref:Uncharacterized protein n=1 Tax=Solanum commersonii TaxID=4109 RepID=A0A9J6A2Y7_SOLCO|nr:hypothetical protein H5410_018364 [Solanum commersonii]
MTLYLLEIKLYYIQGFSGIETKARYAFELLTNKIWKRDHDLFSIDEQFFEKKFVQMILVPKIGICTFFRFPVNHVIEKAKEQYIGRSISEITLPLLETISFDPEDHAVYVINSENFLSKLETDKALLIQIFSPGSTRCAQFSNKWKRIVTLLDGVADTGVIDLADVQLATYLAEKRPGGLPYFRHGKLQPFLTRLIASLTGIPALVAFPPGCRGLRCMSSSKLECALALTSIQFPAYCILLMIIYNLVRYDGELSVDSVTDWVAMSILSLPRIRYYSKESMVTYVI